MRPPRPLPPQTVEWLRPLLKQAHTKLEYQRVQCIWLRASLGLSAVEVAQAIGWHPDHVRKFQARYLKEGKKVLEVGERGGRNHAYLSIKEESAFLKPYGKRAEEGGILVVSEIHQAYEGRVGRKVPQSTVYRMLARHGWRKIAPRSHHPQGNPEQQEAFKKTFQRS